MDQLWQNLSNTQSCLWSCMHMCTCTPVDRTLFQLLYNTHILRLAVKVDNHQLKVIIPGLGIDLSIYMHASHVSKVNSAINKSLRYTSYTIM